MSENYKVYVHINKINRKVYIGITCQEVNRRWRNGNGYRGNEYFYRAIKKYGWENFDHNVLFDGLTKDEAEKIEVDLIKQYKATDKNHGYNIENGGNTNGKHSVETLEKMSNSQLGEKNHMFGKTGDKNTLSKKVICLNNYEVYGSAREAERIFGLSKHVADVCNGKRRFCGDNNGEKLIWMWHDEYKNMTKEEIENYKNKVIEQARESKKTNKGAFGNKNNNSKRIMCIETGEIFECIKYACEHFDISNSSISQNLSKVTKRCRSNKNNKWYSFDFI